ncbi:hypothetical protein HN385_03905 [archaeon]|jgi:hypothetical protein|nr:hypothetical protein [archaeon]MBT3450893.1 hypothetical protein [archaeon]MBT6869075.1 hypothetical protein [archaeon]MBT7193318.1 hypothetical protein [archaeon]MBT7380326.1 hypothetical protein [archaeon]
MSDKQKVNVTVQDVSADETVAPTVLESLVEGLENLEKNNFNSSGNFTLIKKGDELTQHPNIPEFAELINPFQGHSVASYVGRLDRLVNAEGKEDESAMDDKRLAINLYHAGAFNKLHLLTNVPEIIDQYLTGVQRIFHDETDKLRILNVPKNSDNTEEGIVRKYTDVEIAKIVIPQLKSYFTLMLESDDESGNNGLKLFKEIEFGYLSTKQNESDKEKSLAVQNATEDATKSARNLYGGLGLAGMAVLGLVAYNVNSNDGVSAQVLEDANVKLEQANIISAEYEALQTLTYRNLLRKTDSVEGVTSVLNEYTLHHGGALEANNGQEVIDTLIADYKPLNENDNTKVLGLLSEIGFEDNTLNTWEVDSGYQSGWKIE